MKQVLIKSGHVSVEDVPAPALGAGQVLVAVRRSLISSGTEAGFVGGGGAVGFALKKAKDPLNIEKVKRKLASVGMKGTIEVVRDKLFEHQAPGYSTAGVVAEVGAGVPGLRVGDRVACAGMFHASHAEFNAVPHQLVTPIPDGVDFDAAAFVTLGAIAMQGVRRAEVTFGETVAVLGLGLIGQLALQIARAAGCRVIGCDPIAEKRALAAELGAEAVCAPEDLAETAGFWSEGHGVDAAVICAASKQSKVTNQAMDICRQKGRVAVVGAVGMQLEREPLYMKEIDFRLSCSYGPGRHQPAYEEKGLDYPISHVRWTEGRNMAEFLRMLAEGKVRVAPLISLRKPIEEAPAAYAAVLDGEGHAIAALLTYGDDEAPGAPARRMVLRGEAGSGGIGVAVIGAGGFAQAFHLPNLKRLAGARLEAVVAKTGSKAKQAAARFGARYCATDYREVLADPKVDAVVIATRHNLHKEIAMAAAEAGKHIFVEKPMALSVADCEAMMDAAAKAGVLLTVGFNRRCSPYARALKAAVARQPGPSMLLYRCNAGTLPPKHWALDPQEGGGRILGEAVHFFDFACWLFGGDAVSVQARRLETRAESPAADDNLAVLLGFADGSVATVLYCTEGHPSLGKERIEWHGGGSVVIDDFRGIQFAGIPGKSERGRREDKGQLGLLDNFVRAMRGEAALEVTPEDGLRATRIALAALDAARGGGE